MGVTKHLKPDLVCYFDSVLKKINYTNRNEKISLGVSLKISDQICFQFS